MPGSARCCTQATTAPLLRKPFRPSALPSGRVHRSQSADREATVQDEVDSAGVADRLEILLSGAGRSMKLHKTLDRMVRPSNGSPRTARCVRSCPTSSTCGILTSSKERGARGSFRGRTATFAELRERARRAPRRPYWYFLRIWSKFSSCSRKQATTAGSRAVPEPCTIIARLSAWEKAGL